MRSAGDRQLDTRGTDPAGGTADEQGRALADPQRPQPAQRSRSDQRQGPELGATRGCLAGDQSRVHFVELRGRGGPVRSAGSAENPHARVPTGGRSSRRRPPLRCPAPPGRCP